MNIDMEKIFGAKGESTSNFLITNGQGCYIPAYQRPYSWSKDNVFRLFEDAIHGLGLLIDREDAISFLGTIIAIHDKSHKTVQPIFKPEVAQRVMTIIDGQQRICTIAMINIAMHDHLKRFKNKIDKRAEDPHFEWLSHQIQPLESELIDTILLDVKQGDSKFRLYPRIIRSYDDVWSKRETQAKYDSPIAKLVWSYREFLLKDSKEKFKYSAKDENEKIVDKHSTIATTFRVIQNEIEKICAASSNNYDLPKVTNITQSRTFANSIWGYELDESVINYLNEQREDKDYKDYCNVLNLIILAKYINHRMAFTVVTTENEDDAFDMFEALNTTGEPLTAFETFKPKVIDAEGLENYKSSSSFQQVSRIEQYLEKFDKAEQRQIATSDLLIPFALSEKSIKLQKKLNDQRRFLRDTYEGFADNLDSKRTFVQSLADISKFLECTWNYGGQKPRFNGLNLDDKETIMCLAVLKEVNHSIVIAPLSRFYSEALNAESDKKDKKTQDFKEAIKATAAFSILWRGAKGGTNNIDSHYRDIMTNGIDGTPHLAKEDRDSNKGVVSISNYKKMLNSILSDKNKGKISSKDGWIEMASKTPIYRFSPVIAKFILFCALHDSTNDPTNFSLPKKGRKNTFTLLDFETWNKEDYLSIEHIAPRSNSESNPWELKIYDDELEDTIGNFILLPRHENSVIGNRPWSDKKLFYSMLSETNPDKFKEIADECSKQGLTLSNRAKEILENSTYLQVCDSIANHNGEWNSTNIKDRSDRICSLAYDVLIDWL